MRAGTLRHTVAIQERTQADDGMGGFSETWADVAGMSKVRADVYRMRSDEGLDSDKLELKNIDTVKMRYRPGIDAAMRIYWSDKSKTYNITGITNVNERNRVLIFKVTEDV